MQSAQWTASTTEPSECFVRPEVQIDNWGGCNWRERIRCRGAEFIIVGAIDFRCCCYCRICEVVRWSASLQSNSTLQQYYRASSSRTVFLRPLIQCSECHWSSRTFRVTSSIPCDVIKSESQDRVQSLVCCEFECRD